MKNQNPILHTPEGVRDIYGSEFVQKFELQQLLYRVLAGQGYQGIETPTFEFFDVFSREVGTVPSRELYKFFDKEGNTLVVPANLGDLSTLITSAMTMVKGTGAANGASQVLPRP